MKLGKLMIGVLLLAALAHGQIGPRQEKPKLGDTKVDVILDLANLGSAMTDVALTQRCLHDHTCYEANPMMPSSALGQVGVDAALVGFAIVARHELRKHGHPKLARMMPVFGIASHGVGIAATLTR